MNLKTFRMKTVVFLACLGTMPIMALSDSAPIEREPAKSRSVRLMTGPAGTINQAIASGASVEITLQLVEPKTVPATTYPAGSSIVDQTLSLSVTPARVWVDVLVTNWAPDVLFTAQVTISGDDADMDGGGFSGANAECGGGGLPASGDLRPAMQPCNTNPDCRSTMSGMSGSCPQGEPSRCLNWDGFFPGSYFPVGKFCDPGFMVRCHPDWIGAGVIGLSAVDQSTLDFRYGFTTSVDETPTDSFPSYLGTLVLDVPADARGAYTIDVDESESFLQTLANAPNNNIPIAIFRSAAIETPCAPLADPAETDKTRFISFSATSGIAGNSAIRVTLNSLHHVVPPYTGGLSIPFTAFEAGPDCEESGGCVRWVGPPAQYVESQVSGIPFYASQLQCTPHYQDWSTVGLLHVTGSAIVPSSEYEVVAVDASCAGSESTCTAISESLVIRTTRWGDVAEEYNPPSATVQPDVSDISELVNKFRNAPVPKAHLLLAGEPGNPFGEITDAVLDVDLGFSHISACVDAFRGVPYPYTIRSCP